MTASRSCQRCGAVFVREPRSRTVFCSKGCADQQHEDQRAGTPPPAPIPQPIAMLLWCPLCGGRHIDEGEFATKSHHSHACQHCGHVWRPAIVPTVGVQFLPGFKNGAT